MRFRITPPVAFTALSAALVLVAPEASAATRIFYENFDDPGTIDQSIWFNSNNCAKKIVDSSHGAVIHKGACLRGNWKDSFTDPITKLTTADGAPARYSGFNIHVKPEITDEMYLDYWAYVDPDAAKAYGCKWIWFEGTYKPSPSVYDQKFNHILLPPWKGWDTWRISANNSVGESGSSGNRTVELSTIPGIQALMAGQGVDEWFQGRWHHFQIHMKLNTPASAANGIFKFWLDGVVVLDIDDYKFRDNDADLISHFSTPHMYGGGNPPPDSFGWQLDELQVWDGVPDETAVDGGAGSGGDAGSGGNAGSSGSAGTSGSAGSTSSSGGAGGASSGGSAGSSSAGSSGSNGSGGGAGSPSGSGGSAGGGDGGDDGGCSVASRPGGGSLAALFAMAAGALALSRRRRQRVVN